MQPAMEQVHLAKKFIHERARRVLVHFIRRADLLDAAFIHDHYPVRHFQRFFLIMGNEHAGDMHFVMKPAQPGAEFLAYLGIECSERLIQ